MNNSGASSTNQQQADPTFVTTEDAQAADPSLVGWLASPRAERGYRFEFDASERREIKSCVDEHGFACACSSPRYPDQASS